MPAFRRILKRFRLLLVLIIIAIVVGVVVATRPPQAVSLPSQAVQTVQKRTVERTVTTDGKLEGLYTRNVYGTVPQARVDEVRVSVGQFVNRDDHIFTLEVAGRKTKIKAPDWGTITQINFGVNDTLVALTQPLAVITNQTQYRIEAAVNENDVVELAVGQTADLVFSALSLDDKYTAVVESIDPAPIADSATVSYRVVLKPQQLPVRARLGLSVDIEIVTARAENVLAIPESFVIEKDSKFYVKRFTWNDAARTAYTATETEVVIGLASDEYVELKSGVTEGDELIDPSFTIQRSSSFF